MNGAASGSAIAAIASDGGDAHGEIFCAATGDARMRSRSARE